MKEKGTKYKIIESLRSYLTNEMWIIKVLYFTAHNYLCHSITKEVKKNQQHYKTCPFILMHFCCQLDYNRRNEIRHTNSMHDVKLELQ